MEQWPFNGKSLWDSLLPGQKWAAVLGAPLMMVMLRAWVEIWEVVIPCLSIPCKILKMVLLAIGWPVIAYTYANGIGFVIALIIQVLFYRK